MREKPLACQQFMPTKERRKTFHSVLAKNQILFNEARWHEIRRLELEKGNNEHGPKN